MNWRSVLTLLTQALAEQTGERRVLLVLEGAAYHVKELLPGTDGRPNTLLAFVVYQDDPLSAQRSELTSLLFVPPERVQRLLVHGADAAAEGGIGFA